MPMEQNLVTQYSGRAWGLVFAVSMKCTHEHCPTLCSLSMTSTPKGQHVLLQLCKRHSFPGFSYQSKLARTQEASAECSEGQWKAGPGHVNLSALSVVSRSDDALKMCKRICKQTNTTEKVGCISLQTVGLLCTRI